MSVIVIDDHIGSSWWQRDVIAVRYRILSAIGHSQREGIAARYRRLKLFSCHKATIAQNLWSCKGVWFVETGGSFPAENLF